VLTYSAQDLVPLYEAPGRDWITLRGLSADLYRRLVGDIDQLAKKKCIRYCNTQCHEVCTAARSQFSQYNYSPNLNYQLINSRPIYTQMEEKRIRIIGNQPDPQLFISTEPGTITYSAQDLIASYQPASGQEILRGPAADLYRRLVGDIDQLAKKKCIRYCNTQCHEVCTG
jgi:hypothetical protein